MPLLVLDGDRTTRGHGLLDLSGDLLIENAEVPGVPLNSAAGGGVADAEIVEDQRPLPGFGDGPFAAELDDVAAAVALAVGADAAQVVIAAQPTSPKSRRAMTPTMVAVFPMFTRLSVLSYCQCLVPDVVFAEFVNQARVVVFISRYSWSAFGPVVVSVERHFIGAH